MVCGPCSTVRWPIQPRNRSRRYGDSQTFRCSFRIILTGLFAGIASPVDGCVKVRDYGYLCGGYQGLGMPDFSKYIVQAAGLLLVTVGSGGRGRVSAHRSAPGLSRG